MEFSREAVNQIKDLVDPDKVLALVGFIPRSRSSREIRGPCPIHKGDNLTGFRFDIEKKTFSCFTRSCHDNGNDLVSLVMSTLGYNFLEAVKFLANIAGVDLDTYTIDPVVQSAREIKKYISTEEKLKRYKALSPDVPEDLVKLYMMNRTSFYKDRGFPEELLDYFEIGTAMDDYGTKRATIPIRDEQCRLVGFSGRRLDNDEKIPKFIPVGIPFEKSKVLYNLCSAKEAILSTTARAAILVEGYSDVWHMVRHGYRNTISPMGVEVMEPQVHLLSKYCLTLYLMLDPDSAGARATEKNYKILSKAFKVHKLYIPQQKDPDGLTAEEIREVLFNGGYFK